MGVADAANLSHLDTIGRLMVAVTLGTALGLERELKGQEAGLRTHALLALGAGVFGVVSVGAFGSFSTDSVTSNVQVDVTRIASYVAAGVGFLAGGAIVKEGPRVKGLTTAAALWVCAAVGLAAGLGFYVAAVSGTCAALLMLVLDRPLNHLRRSKQRVTLSVRLGAAALISEIMTALLEAPEPTQNVTSHSRSDGGLELEISDLRLSAARQLMVRLAVMPGVDEVKILGV